MGAKAEPVPNLIGSPDRPCHRFPGVQRPRVASARGVLARADEMGLTALGAKPADPREEHRRSDLA